MGGKYIQVPLEKIEIEYQQAIQNMIDNGITLTASTMVEFTVNMFQKLQVKDISDSDNADNDMLLFQYGIYNFDLSNVEYFILVQLSLICSLFFYHTQTSPFLLEKRKWRTKENQTVSSFLRTVFLLLGNKLVALFALCETSPSHFLWKMTRACLKKA